MHNIYMCMYTPVVEEVVGADQSIESEGASRQPPRSCSHSSFHIIILSESSPDLRFWCNLKLKFFVKVSEQCVG